MHLFFVFKYDRSKASFLAVIIKRYYADMCLGFYPIFSLLKKRKQILR